MNDKAKRLHYMYIQTPPLSRDPTTTCSELLQEERSGCGLFTSLATRPSRISRHRVSGNQPFGVDYQGTTMDNTQCKGRNPEWKRSDLLEHDFGLLLPLVLPARPLAVVETQRWTCSLFQGVDYFIVSVDMLNVYKLYWYYLQLTFTTDLIKLTLH